MGKLYPKEYVDSTYVVDFEKFYESGYRGLIYDIDNTMVKHGAPANDQAIALFKRLREIGFTTCALSNNKEPRVKMFCDAVDSKYLYRGGKPNPAGYEKAMEIMGTNKENTLFIGDQIFTDVWGANKAGIYSILVKPIDPKEEIQIVIKRRFEWFVLKAYKRYIKKQ